MAATFGKAKKSGKPRLAPKVPIPKAKKPNVMKESDKVPMRRSPMAPMTGKKLSK
jgi:hypothetical protein